jgi:hypothetical protein
MTGFVEWNRAVQWIAFGSLSWTGEQEVYRALTPADAPDSFVMMTPDWDTEGAAQGGALGLASEMLMAAACSGAVTVVGIPDRDKEYLASDANRIDPRLHNRVPPDLFQHAVIEEDEITGGEQTFHELYVDLESLKATFAFLERWREGSSDDQENAANGNGLSAAAESKCREFLRELAATNPAAPPRKLEVLRAAQEKISGLSERAFYRAWGSTAPIAWKSAGRRKSLR